MGLQKLHNIRQRQGGFTIVELLVVIVVIGILAAITIVAYNGITAKANAATARSNAESVQKVAEAYNADNSIYPTLAQITGTWTNQSSQLPSSLNGGTTVVATNGALTTGAGLVNGADASKCAGGTANSVTATCLGIANGTKDIIFVPKGTTGDCIGYYDYAAGVTAWVYAGNATTQTAASNVITCA